MLKYVALTSDELEEWRDDPEGYIRQVLCNMCYFCVNTKICVIFGWLQFVLCRSWVWWVVESGRQAGAEAQPLSAPLPLCS